MAEKGVDGVSNQADRLLRVTALEGRLRGLFVRATRTVETARRRHDTYPVATAVLGRTLIVALMLAATLKGEEHVTVRILGDGPIGAVVADADGQGHVRGYVQEPHLLLPIRQDGKLDVARAVGKGIFAVSRHIEGQHPYASSVELVSGEIGLDFVHYLRESEQIPSAVSVGVHVSRTGRVGAAGGILLQVLPGGEELADSLAERLTAFGSVSEALRAGVTPEDMVEQMFRGWPKHILETRTVRFRCRCTRTKSREALVALGEEELAALLAEDGGAEVRCHFCNQVYRFTRDEVADLWLQARAAREGRP